MSDNEIRELERLGDAITPIEREHLERLWLRAGRGWHGEALVEGLRATEERGVYVWKHLEMVRVPEKLGDIINSASRNDGATLQVRIVEPAFYIGRYPVTDLEWERAYHLRFAPSRRVRDLPGHPHVNVTYADARHFCAWAGLRLPTSAEWTRAALGDETVPCRCDGPGVQPHRFAFGLACPRCRGTGAARPLYPWGNEAPTPERCVAAFMDEALRRLGNNWGDPLPPRTTLAVRDADDRPARPDGASPCGAHDMYGHVWEMTMDSAAHGGSFRGINETYRSTINPANDVGFRVAL